MTPAARLAAAIDILERFEAGEGPAERVVAAWGRRARYAGSKDRAAVADRVFDCLRRRRSLAWAAGGTSARAAAIGSALDEGADPAALFDGRGHAPAALDEAERAALAAPRPPAPDPVRLDYPDWLDAPLRESLGARFEPAMEALRRRAPVDLRVNALRADRERARAALAEEGVETVPVDDAPLCLRAAPGAPVARTRAWLDGLVEPQDAASQMVAAFADARPGEVVLDYCAGGGGKALALAAAMGGEGRVIAHDASARRMADLPARAARAGARIEIAAPGALAALEGRCDLVFVDAPCSGSGAWRRDPGGKWRLDAERLAALVALQRTILREAARFARPGGRIAYATCSVLAAENEAAGALDGARPLRRLAITPDLKMDGFHCEMFAVHRSLT